MSDYVKDLINMKFCLIYNKKSANGRKSKYIREIYKEISKNYSIKLFETTSKHEASIVIKNIGNDKYDRLILAGGDGSVSFAINELILNKVALPSHFALGYIPTGTANILQAELNLKKQVCHIVKVLTSNKIKKANIIKINHNYFILMAGLGWDAKIIQSIKPTAKKIFGKMLFIIKFFQNFVFMKNEKFKITTNNEEFFADWVLCCNSRYYAGHHTINNTNIFKDEIIIFIFKDLKRIQLLYYICLLIFSGKISSSESVIIKKSNKIIIESMTKDIPVQIDGDDFGNYKRVDIINSGIKFNLIHSI